MGFTSLLRVLINSFNNTGIDNLGRIKEEDGSNANVR